MTGQIRQLPGEPGSQPDRPGCIIVDDEPVCPSDPGPSIPPSALPPPGCFVLLLSQSAAFAGDPLQHTSIELLDPSQNLRPQYLEAGPQPVHPNHFGSAQWLNKNKDPQKPLYSGQDPAVSTSWLEPESECELLKTLFSHYKNNHILYNDTAIYSGPNSNSFTHSLLNAAGLHVSFFNNLDLLISAPGWGNTSILFD